jgi:hypothetical protein
MNIYLRYIQLSTFYLGVRQHFCCSNANLMTRNFNEDHCEFNTEIQICKALARQEF